MGTLWAPPLLQFSTDCFETLHLLSAWNEDVHVVWVNTLIIFSYFFCFANLVSLLVWVYYLYCLFTFSAL